MSRLNLTHHPVALVQSAVALRALVPSRLTVLRSPADPWLIASVSIRETESLLS